jgi:NADH:ubiquinone oxidoreductase subunit
VLVTLHPKTGAWECWLHYIHRQEPGSVGYTTSSQEQREMNVSMNICNTQEPKAGGLWV